MAARLFAFFPRTSGGEEQAMLYAEKLQRYPVDAGARGIDKVIETRVDPSPPAWAELRQWVEAELPHRLEIAESPGVPPPPEVLATWRELKVRVNEKGERL